MQFDIDAYLQRMGYYGDRSPTLETLRALHRAHLLSVPFENLNIGLGWPILTTEDALFQKIVVGRRGGFCYELNGLFAALLRVLGFDVTLLSARVVNGAGEVGPEFDHLTLLVQLEECWLADVGFGDSFVEPLRLDQPEEQVQESAAYRVTHDGEQWSVLERVAGEWKPQYYFSLQPRRIEDFNAMCRFHQSSPDSPFTRKRVCTRATSSGRITLSDDRLIVTEHGQRTERQLRGDDEWDAILRNWFGITLPR